MACRPGERTKLRWGLKPGSYKVTARQDRRRGLGHLDAGPTDHSEGIFASYRKGQVRAEMTWHIIAVTENSALWIPRCQRHFRHSGRARQRSFRRGVTSLFAMMPCHRCTLRYPVQMSVATRLETEDPHMLSPQRATRSISRNSGGGRFQSAKVRTGILRPGDNRRRRLRRPAHRGGVLR